MYFDLRKIKDEISILASVTLPLSTITMTLAEVHLIDEIGLCSFNCEQSFPVSVAELGPVYMEASYSVYRVGITRLFLKYGYYTYFAPKRAEI